jgi:Class II Aldolase and Adducin N-terminal domain
MKPKIYRNIREHNKIIKRKIEKRVFSIGFNHQYKNFTTKMSSSMPPSVITETETPLHLQPEATANGEEKFFEDVHFLGDKEGKVKIRSPPQLTNKLDAQKYQKQHLAVAFRVFAKQGFDEGVAGHISLRDPINPGTFLEIPHIGFYSRLILSLENFWINPLSMHFSQIKVSDLVLVNENGEVQPGGAQAAINGPAFAIHSEIHKARPDLNAACHAHSVYGKAFSCFGRVIEPLYQDALRFYNDLSGMYSF